MRPDHAARAADAGRRPRTSSTRRLLPRTLDSNVSSQTHDGDIPLTAGAYLRVIWALSGYDGMCRPWGYQSFVFFRGAFRARRRGRLAGRDLPALRRLRSALLSLAPHAGALSHRPHRERADPRPGRRSWHRRPRPSVRALTCVDSERRHFVGPEADWTASSGMDSRAAAAN